MPPPKKPIPKGKQRPDDAYQHGDAIPTGEALEKDTDTAWALFHELTEKQERKFSPTVPGSVPASLSGALSSRSRGNAATAPATLPQQPPANRNAPLGVDELMIEARRNNRVCPRLDDWGKLYDMLPGKEVVDGKLVPPPPISPQAWRVTSAMVKRLCLRDHLEWAASHDAVVPVLIFLRGLPEENWLHME